MNPLDFLNAFKDLTKKLFVVDEKIGNLEVHSSEMRRENAELRKK